MKTFCSIFFLVLSVLSAVAQTYIGSTDQLKTTIDPLALRPGQAMVVVTNGLTLSFYPEVGTVASDSPVEFASTKRSGYVWKCAWDGDPRVFGMKFGNSTTNDANANQLAFTNAIAWSRTTGIPIQCPPGNTHVHGEFDVSGLNEISGSGVAGPALQTAFIVCTKGATLFKNATTGMKFSKFWTRPLYMSWFRDDVTSVAIKTAPGESYAIVIEDIEAKAYRPLWLESFDCSIRDCTLWGVQGIYMPGGGTQSEITRVGIRGLIEACSTNSDTVVTFSSYTAGTTNLTVSDGSVFRTGDIIVIANGTTAGYSSAYIPQKNWGRRITAVSGNNLTISHPWPTSVANGQVFYLLGQGAKAVYSITGQNFSNLNIEWGSWDNIVQCSGPGTYSFNGFHIEGWCVNRPGANAYVFSSDLASINIQAMKCWNWSVLDALLVGVCDSGGSYNINGIEIRDIDLLLANKLFYIAAIRSPTRAAPVRVTNVDNWGTVLAPVVVNNYETQGTTMLFGEQSILQQRVGRTNMHFYGYSSTPTFGSFVAGDRIFLPTNTLAVFSSGTLGTPAGSNRIRANSRVLVTDLAGFQTMGQRLVVSLGGSPYVVDRPNLGGPTTLTLASNAAVGDRDVWVSITGPYVPTVGDWGIITDTNNVNREDVRITRFTTSTSPDRAHLMLPLSTNYQAGSVFETGTYMSSASAVDVTNLTAIVYPTPVFVSPIQPGTNGSFSSSGSATIGASTIGTTLDLIGGASGQRLIKMTRPGVFTNSIGGSLQQFHVVEESVPGGKYFIFSAEATETAAAVYIGGNNAANRTNGIPTTLKGSSANLTLGANPNLAGGDLTIQPGPGTGNGSLASILFQVPANEASAATNPQPWRTVLKLKKPTVIDTNSANTGVILPVWTNSITGTPSDLRLVATNEGGIWRLILIP